MPKEHQRFARALVSDLLARESGLVAHSEDPHKVLAEREDGRWASLDLTPFEADPMPADARPFFHGIDTIDGLLDAYHRAKKARPFEEDLAGALDQVDDYARRYLSGLLEAARTSFRNDDARLVAEWVSCLDLYTAVKAVESLLKSKADLVLLKIAARRGWTVHFDHLAIRCGTSARRDAERVEENLRRCHGYVAPQVAGEYFYQFEDGWNAYVLYKMLDNGQILRLFIDQSDADADTQIIRHWNHVYGYTAHHLGIRATRQENGECVAIPLEELTAALKAEGVEVMTPTGGYTAGLLLQVFTRPERNRDIPAPIRKQLRRYDTMLEASIENGKLLELLSRREMPEAFKDRFFELYGLRFEPGNPLHSAPAYCYFLPAQAAHVIRTSVEIA